MGTRAIIIVTDGTNEAALYSKNDGFPQHLGLEIYYALKDKYSSIWLEDKVKVFGNVDVAALYLIEYIELYLSEIRMSEIIDLKEDLIEWVYIIDINVGDIKVKHYGDTYYNGSIKLLENTINTKNNNI